ncbi:MAG: hypothetical protein H7124_05590 [Phycisphaerales bacterium]|nr:hypothetical protein [Hyphomonadaceae bacterium]
MIALCASYLLILAVFMLITWATHARGWGLVAGLFALGLGVGSFNLLIEAVAFGVLSWQEAAKSFAVQTAVVAALAALAMLAARLFPPALNAPTLRFDAPRLIAIVLAYEALYITAGVAVFPYVSDYYAAHQIPHIGEVMALQAARACIFAAVAAVLLRGGLRYASLVLGVAFSVVGGLAPLLPDNPFMPPQLRALHAIEVGVSNFLFGAIVGWLLTRKPKPASAQAAP